jgi:hypothetical protein
MVFELLNVGSPFRLVNSQLLADYKQPDHCPLFLQPSSESVAGFAGGGWRWGSGALPREHRDSAPENDRGRPFAASAMGRAGGVVRGHPRPACGPAIGIPRGGKRGAADQRLIRDAARRVLSGIRRYPLATRSARAAGGARNRKSGRGDRRTAHSASGQARQRAKPWWRRLVG